VDENVCHVEAFGYCGKRVEDRRLEERLNAPQRGPGFSLEGSMKKLILLPIIAVLVLGFVLTKACATKGDQQKADAAADSQSKPPETQDKKDADCGCDKAPPDVFATVNGTKIASKDVDEPIKDRIKELQDRVVEARKHQLDFEINSRLLEAEARRLGISPQKLLEREVPQRVMSPTEAEARAFYDENKSNIEGEFKDVKGQIIGYLLSQRRADEAKKFADRLRVSAKVEVLTDDVTPPATEADRARVFATVNGIRVTSGDVEDALKPMVFSIQEQIYDLRKKALDVKINDLLLDEAAKKKNVTSDALFNSEILPRVKPVTEKDIRKFFDENKEKINSDYQQVRPQILQMLQNREQGNAASAYAEELRKAAVLEVFLRPPDPPVINISIDDRPWTGGANAPVTIVEFTDFECPSCANAQPVMEALVKEFGDKVKLVAHSFPLEQHKHAFKAAEAAEAAREQGKYWEYTAILFKNQKELEVEKLKTYAGQLGLDRKRFDDALDSGKFTDAIKQELSIGDRIGVDSTPSLFINGKRIREKTREALKSAIEAALKDAAKK
jgi:protein-disulfide isomerase